MKKLATGITLSAALGLSLFAAAPAQAETAPKNCGEVYARGYSHVPKGHEWYTAKMDGGGDGIACENSGNKYKDLIRLDQPGGNTSGGYHDPTDQALPDEAYTYADCKDAYAAGVFNIPADSEDYHDDLDSDQDGVGCEYNVQYGVIMEGREAAAAEEIAAIKAGAVKDEEKAEPVADEPQVTQVPVGAVDAGVTPDSDPAAALTVGALGLAAVAGAGVAARRRARA